MSAALAAEDPHGGRDHGPDTEADIDVAGYRLHVALHPGAPGRRPLVLANGIGASLQLLEPLVEALDPDRPVIRFDVPGIGGSPLPWVPLPMAGLAALVAGLLDRAGPRQAPTSWVCRGAGGSPSSSPCSTPNASAGWPWSAPGPAR